MRIVVYGAGAVGGVVGSLLHRSGTPVTLVARGAHLAAIQADGLRLVTPSLDVTQRIPAVGGPSEIDWSGDEVVLVAAKSNSTPGIAETLARVAPGVAVISLQNGVRNEPTLARWFDDVHGVTVMAPTSHLQPGVVHARSAGAPAILDVGRWPAGVDDTDTAVAAAFVAAGIESQPRPDIMAWKYRKLLMNLGNIVDACCVPDQAAEQLADRLRAEAEQVLAAAGITVIPEDVDLARRGDLLRRGPSVVPSGGSTWQSLTRGTGSLETEFLNGEIVHLGAAHDVPTPLNARALELAGRALAESLPPRSVPAQTLLD